MSQGIDETSEKNTARWDALARLVGYNELARDAKTVGEKLYLRLARDMAEEAYVALGGQVKRSETSEEIVVPTRPPFIVLGPDDIELMRRAVIEYDASSTIGNSTTTRSPR